MSESSNVDNKNIVVQHLNVAQRALAAAYQHALQSNPMAADLPVFEEVQRVQKLVGALMQQVGKVRGL